MSVLVRDPASGERKLFCKGADSNMLPRLARPQTQVSLSGSSSLCGCVVRENDASTAMALVAVLGKEVTAALCFRYIIASISLRQDSNLF
jgi:hypothetical protein